MSTSRFLVAGLLAAVSLTISGCGNRDLNYKQVEVDELKDQVRDLEDQLDACEKSKMGGWMHEHPNATGSEIGNSIGDGVTVKGREVETYITVPGSVLFTPGSAKLTTEAKSVLSRIIELVHEKYPGHYLRIDGFTDNEPVVRSKDKWDDNFDLSGGRALSVLHYLEAHGVPQKDLGFSGFGQEQAVASNTTESNRSKNRRVEIVVSAETHADDAIPEDTGPAEKATPKKAVHHKKKPKPVTPPATSEPSSSSLEPGPSSSGFSSSGGTTSSGFSGSGSTTSGFSSTGGTTSSGFPSSGTSSFSSTGGTTSTAPASTAPAASSTTASTPPAHTTP